MKYWLKKGKYNLINNYLIFFDDSSMINCVNFLYLLKKPTDAKLHTLTAFTRGLNNISVNFYAEVIGLTSISVLLCQFHYFSAITRYQMMIQFLLMFYSKQVYSSV